MVLAGLTRQLQSLLPQGREHAGKRGSSMTRGIYSVAVRGALYTQAGGPRPSPDVSPHCVVFL